MSDCDHNIQTKGKARKRQRICNGTPIAAHPRWTAWVRTAIAAVRHAHCSIQPDDGSTRQRCIATQARSALQAGCYFWTKKAFRHVLVAFGCSHLLTSWVTLWGSLPL